MHDRREDVDAVAYLHAVATLACVNTGRVYRIERSDRSEAFYVKVLRPGPHPAAGKHWWGTRVACHLPAYRCSHDYAQVHVLRTAAGPAELADAERELVAHVRTGGVPVADPNEVDEALFAAFRAERDGTERGGPAGTRWRWDEQRLRWRLIAVDGTPVANIPPDLRRSLAGFAPPEAPAATLHPRTASSVRHRLNRRARWEYEEAVAAANDAGADGR